MRSNNQTLENCSHEVKKPCPQLPGTILRIFLPAGTTINLLNIIELTSPSGICLIIRLPILAGDLGANPIVQAIQQAGGTIEFCNS